MKNKLRNSITSVLLAVILLMNIAVSFGVGEKNNNITINTERDFLKFAENCVSDSYSKGKTFELTADLDFTDKIFKQVPIFSGEFIGNSHIIKGIKLEEKGSNQGVFRYIDENAIVQDLKINAILKPKGTMENIGILCGTNRGTILRCYTDGYVKGEINVGGVAGKNELNGVIEGCISKTGVYGNKNVGGITGKNEGNIRSSTSKGFINTDADRTANNTGGIVGNNSGTINMCYNYGTVGYNHSGYNVGGISGIQSGIILSSYNYAQIVGRKDVGGIVGQFEPDITISYGTDKAEILKNDLKNINVLINNLTNQMSSTINSELDSIENINKYIEKINDLLNNSAQSIYDDVSDTSSDITYYIDRIDQTGSDISNAGDDVSRVLKTSQSALEAATERFIIAIHNAMNSGGNSGGGNNSDTNDNSSNDNGSDWLPPFVPPVSPIPPIPHFNTPDFDAISAAVTQYISDINSISGIMINTIGNSFGTVSSGVSSITGSISGVQHSINDAIQKQTNELSYSTKEINGYISQINKEMNKMTSVGKEGNNAMQETFNSIKNQIDMLVDDVSEMLKLPEFEIKDISQTINTDPQNGEIRKCQNFGIIKADSNVGGIVGIMGKELSRDPEEDLLPEDRKAVDTTALFRALVLECSNNAQVVSKNDCGGGIAGKQDTGAIFKNTNKGKVTVENGNYCGGIAGISTGNIINCFVQSTLKGNDNVGGIAGKGNNIKDNYIMSVIESDGEKIGSVAGEISGEMFNNYFVYEGHQAVDGINYEGQAYPISYENFKDIKEIPSNFFIYRINFIVNGNTIKTVPVEYGGTITQNNIPAIPEIEGYYGQWEDFQKYNIKRTTDVNCIYTPYITTISYGEGVPEVLAEGRFSPEAKIIFSKIEKGPETDGKDYIIQSYNTRVVDENKDVSPILKIRLRCTDNENIRVYVRKGDVWENTNFEIDGSYIVVNAPNGADISVVRHYDYSGIIKKVILIAGLIVFIGGGGTLFYHHNKENLKDKPTKPDDKNKPENKTKPHKQKKIKKSKEEKKPKTKPNN